MGSSGSHLKELGIGFIEPEGQRTPQEQKHQLILSHGGSKRLNHQPRSMQELDQDPPTFVGKVQLGLHIDPLTIVGLSQNLFPCLYLEILGLDIQRVVLLKGGFPLSEEKGRR